METIRLEALVAFREGRYLDLARRGCQVAGQLGSTQLLGECAAFCTLASQRLTKPQLAERYHRTAADCFTALGARPALRRLGPGTRD